MESAAWAGMERERLYNRVETAAREIAASFPRGLKPPQEKLAAYDIIDAVRQLRYTDREERAGA